jgi:anti-sigma B factor antagonist
MLATQSPYSSPYSWMKVDRIGPVTVVRLIGRAIVEEGAIRLISAELARLVEKFGNRRVLLNFGEVKNLSSYMLAGIVHVHKKIHAVGGELFLCGLNPDLRKVFELTRLTKLVKIYPDEKSALGDN